MKLRARVPLYVGFVLLFQIGVLYLVIVNAVLDQAKEIEKSAMSENMDRVQDAVHRELATMQTSTADYASWDDTYQFARDKNKKYIDSNFGSSSFQNLKINLVAVFNDKKQLVYSRRYDWENSRDLSPVQEKDVEYMLNNHPDLFTMSKSGDEYSDYFDVDGGLMLVAGRPILTSENKGPSMGTLVMMRNFDGGYMKKLSSITQLNVEDLKDDSPETISKIFSAEKLQAPQTQRVISFLNDNAMESIFTVKDDEGVVEAILKITKERNVYGLVLETVQRLFLVMVLLALILLLSTLAILDRFILRRLSKLSNAMVHYETDPSLLQLIKESGNDELATLAKIMKTTGRHIESSRKKMKEHDSRMELERKRLEAILNSITEGVIVVDHDGKILLANRMAKEISGRTLEELFHEPFQKSLKFVSGHARVGANFLKPVLDSGAIAQTGNDTVFVPKKGEPIHVSVAAAPIKRQNEVIGSVVVFKDMSREFEVDKMKSEFVSIASHQLRTPLTGIKWMISLLLQGRAGKLSKTQHEFVKNINDSNERMIQLVNDLLNISRIESTTAQQLEKVPCDLPRLIEGVVKEQASIAHQHDVNLEVVADPKGAKVSLTADHDKLYQVLMNLANNAIKYSTKGGAVHIGYGLEGGFVKISFKDAGIGIPKEQQSRIFEKFFRADNATKSVATGTGLGLYYVKMVVEAHGGRVWFDSAADDGTTFYVTLPVSQP